MMGLVMMELGRERERHTKKEKRWKHKERHRYVDED